MKCKQYYWLSVPIFALVLGVVVLSCRKTVILQVDDERQTLTTYALNVGQLLNAVGLTVAEEDRLTPSPHAWLKDGQVVNLERAVPIYVLADGRLTAFNSAERLPILLLASVSLSLDGQDQLLVDGQLASPLEALKPGISHTLAVLRTQDIVIQEGAQVQRISSTSSSLGQALWNGGFRLRSADRLSLPFDYPLVVPGQPASMQEILVNLIRARAITVRLDGQERLFYSAAATVGEALAEAGLALQGLDYSQPAAEAAIPADGVIALVRVREDLIIEQTPLPFGNEFQAAPDLEIDNQSILQAGEYGLTARRIRVRYENDQEVSRLVENEWVARSPVSQIIGYGTKLVKRALDTPNGVIYYWRALRMWATSYHPPRKADRVRLRACR